MIIVNYKLITDHATYSIILCAFNNIETDLVCDNLYLK